MQLSEHGQQGSFFYFYTPHRKIVMDSPADLLTLYPQHLPSEGEGRRMQRRLPFDNPEVRLGSVRRSVLFPSGNYFRLRSHEVFDISVLQTKSERCRAVMRTPGLGISLHPTVDL